MSREKPSLPHGWVVKQSGSYPDRVYYFNIHTGVSTWNMPKLVKPGVVSKQTILKQKSATSPFSKFSSNDDSDSSDSVYDTEKHDPKNEPVFSQFQKEIFDDVITNSPSQHRDEADSKPPKPPQTPGKEFISPECETENVGDGFQCIPPPKMKWEVDGGEVEYKGEGFEFPRVTVKKEKTGSYGGGTSTRVTSDKGRINSTKSSTFQISEMLSKIRKEGDKKESDSRSQKTPNIDKREVDQESIKSGSNTSKAESGEKTVRKVVHISEKDMVKTVTTPVTKPGQVSDNVLNSSEILTTPGGQGIWTRKRKISLEGKREEVPSKLEKLHSKPDLSLEIRLGEKRQVLLSPKRAVVIRSVSSDSLDLTAQSPPLHPEATLISVGSPGSEHVGPETTAHDPFKKLEKKVSSNASTGKSRRRKVSMVTDKDVRKVVSPDNQSDSNNSGLSDVKGTPKQLRTETLGHIGRLCDLKRPNLQPLQDDTIGRIQAWVDHIDPSPRSEEFPVKSPDEQQVQALPEQQQDESEFCDMEVDEEEDGLESEQMITDLQEVREELQFCPSQPVCDLSIPPSVIPAASCSSAQVLYLILDTSSLMNHLRTLSDLRDDQIEGYGLPCLVIPWVVLQELDVLKDNRSKQTFSVNSQNRANKAVKYLHACFTGRHPRVIGQSPKEASEVVDGLTVECNDDRVLQCCLQYRNKYPSSTVVMLSEDVNLCNKARVSGLEACSAKDLSHVLTHLDNSSSPGQSQEPGGLRNSVDSSNKHHLPASVTLPSLPSSSLESSSFSCPVTAKAAASVKMQRSQLDRVVVKVKAEIKATLGPVLETEMKAAYQNIWKDIVYRKPPWSALDIMESFKKHWIAIFGLILPRHLSPIIESIVTKLQLNKVPLLSVSEVIELVQDLLTLLNSLKKHSSYSGKVDKSVDKLMTVQSDLQKDDSSKSTPSPQRVQYSSVQTNPKHQSPLQPRHSHPQSSVQTSSKMPMDSVSSDEVKSNTISSEQQSPLPSTSTSVVTVKPWMKVKPASGSPQSAAETSCAADDFELVENCFQIVWSSIFNLCVDIEKSLLTSFTNHHLSLLNRLIPLIKDLRFDFAMCLSISPYEIYNERRKFEDLCNQLNSFFVKLKHEPVEMEPVTTDALLAFFHCTDKRPTLQVGLTQLDTIITNLHELIKSLPD